MKFTSRGLISSINHGVKTSAALGVLLCAAACSESVSTAACDGATLDVTGVWLDTYTCSDTCAGAVNGTVTFTMVQSGATVTFTDDMGSSFTGTLSGRTLDWSGGNGAGYTESGRLVFACDGRTFEKPNSSYTVSGCNGSCTGSGVRQR